MQDKWWACGVARTIYTTPRGEDGWKRIKRTCSNGNHLGESDSVHREEGEYYNGFLHRGAGVDAHADEDAQFIASRAVPESTPVPTRSHSSSRARGAGVNQILGKDARHLLICRLPSSRSMKTV